MRDRDRLQRAMHGIDVVVHAAALKQIPSCEYNPFEAIQTNVIGAQNVIDAAIDQGVKRVMALSTDKAVNPINLYGATKLCAEKLFVQGNAYGYGRGTVFSVVRYGNVVGSRGSVIPLFAAQRATGTVTVTDPGMTRFWLRLEEGVGFVIRCTELMHGGEIFVPKIPSMRMLDLVEAMAPGCRVEVIGIRPGEKLHEALIAEEESRQVVEFDDMFVLEPIYPSWAFAGLEGGKRPARGSATPARRTISGCRPPRCRSWPVTERLAIEGGRPVRASLLPYGRQLIERRRHRRRHRGAARRRS